LASGVFASILKLMQIQGVFKEELEKLIFEPKFLGIRKDIPVYWEKISQELFKNKFPSISTQILEDIKGTYLPTNQMIYYDEVDHYYNIELVNDEVTCKSTNSMVITGANKNEEVIYEFSNKIQLGENQSASYRKNFIKVNGTVIADNHQKGGVVELFEKKETATAEYISTTYKLVLKGAERYNIDKEEVKKYKIQDNPLVQYKAAKLTNKLKVDISYSENLTIEFLKIGTLNTFVERQKENNFVKLHYSGIIYPEQGYVIQINKKQIV